MRKLIAVVSTAVLAWLVVATGVSAAPALAQAVPQPVAVYQTDAHQTNITVAPGTTPAARLAPIAVAQAVTATATVRPSLLQIGVAAVAAQPSTAPTAAPLTVTALITQTAPVTGITTGITTNGILAAGTSALCPRSVHCHDAVGRGLRCSVTGHDRGRSH